MERSRQLDFALLARALLLPNMLAQDYAKLCAELHLPKLQLNTSEGSSCFVYYPVLICANCARVHKDRQSAWLVSPVCSSCCKPNKNFSKFLQYRADHANNFLTRLLPPTRQALVNYLESLPYEYLYPNFRSAFDG